MRTSPWTLQSDGLPPDSSSLVDALDRHYPPATVRDARDVADEQARYDLAFRAGKRAVVEELRQFQKRQQERQRDGI